MTGRGVNQIDDIERHVVADRVKGDSHHYDTQMLVYKFLLLTQTTNNLKIFSMSGFTKSRHVLRKRSIEPMGEAEISNNGD